MTNYIVKEGQNLIDVALQLYGHAEKIVSLCNDNNLGINSPLLGGQVLTYDETFALDDDNVRYYRLSVLDVVTNTDQGQKMVEYSESEYTSQEHN